MKKRFIYIGIVSLMSLGIFIVLYFGNAHSNSLYTSTSLEFITANGLQSDLESIITKQFHHPLALLLSQIIIIMIATRFFGFMSTKIFLPIVVGEIAAGIFLGPSFIGTYFPDFSSQLFPEHSFGNLSLISQLGLIFFMFVIGMELDWQNLKNQTKASVIISHSSILFPFFLGVTLSLFLYDRFAPQGTSFIPFALFIGISMSITAFPVLARIVKEKQLCNTSHGAMALTCAAADDATAWYLLAVIITISSSSSMITTLVTLFLILSYMIIMIYAIKPFLYWLGKKYTNEASLDMGGVSIILTILLISSLTTEMIGIHALFGAFMAGAMMPSVRDSRLRELVAPKLEYVSILVLLPLFFALTGLRTQIGLMQSSYEWFVGFIILFTAIFGKLLGATLSSRFMGFSWQESWSIGTLMNTRGLMELIVLNIGFELGIISVELFSMFVLMALITTAMTGPLLYFIDKKFDNTQVGIQINNFVPINNRCNV